MQGEINDGDHEKKEKKKKTKGEITYLFMFFICTEKCELLHLATRTHMKLGIHLNIDRFEFPSLVLFHICVDFANCFLFFFFVCTISMVTYFFKEHGMMIYAPFARFAFIYVIKEAKKKESDRESTNNIITQGSRDTHSTTHSKYKLLGNYELN